MYVLEIIVCPFVIFLLASVLSVLLRHTEYDYPFGLFKLFLLYCVVSGEATPTDFIVFGLTRSGLKPTI
jgi:hypothetical protein